MAYAALLGLVLFFVGWGIAFFVSLSRAPAQLDAACQKEVNELRTELTLPDKALADHLRGLLAQISESATMVLKFVILYDVIETQQMKIAGLSFNDMLKASQECVSVGLLRVEYDAIDLTSPLAIATSRSFYQVPPEFRETLKRLLYAVPESTQNTGSIPSSYIS